MLASDTITLTDLRRRTSACIRRAEEFGRPLYITRRGEVIAVLMTLEQYELMQRPKAEAFRAARRPCGIPDIVYSRKQGT